MNNECPFCGQPSNPGCLCSDCAAAEERDSLEWEQSCSDEGGEDGYASGGWDDGREAFSDPGHFEG